MKFPRRWGHNRGAGGGETDKQTKEAPSPAWKRLSPDQWRRTSLHRTRPPSAAPKSIRAAPRYVCLFVCFEMAIKSAALMRGWDVFAPLASAEIDGKNKRHGRKAINPTVAVGSHREVG